MLSFKLQTDIVCIEKLSSQRKKRLVEEIVVVDEAVFDDFAEVRPNEKFLGNHSDETWILTLRHDGELVGYNCILIKNVSFQGETISCWGSRAAILPAYRGEKKTAKFAINHYFRYRLTHPFRKIYGLISLGHPSSFYLFAKLIPNLYPFPRKELPPKEREIYQYLLGLTGRSSVPGKPEFMIFPKCITKTSDIEKDFWNRHTDPTLVFYHQHCTAYVDGYSIMSFFKINLPTMLGTMLNFLKSSNKLIESLPLIGPSRKKKSQLKKLQSLPIFASFSEKLLELLLSRLKTIHLKSNEYLFRTGDQDRTIYIVQKGSLYITLESEEGESTIAQLLPGDLVGEFGLMYGSRRSASAKAFRSVELLKIGIDEYETLQLMEPEFDKETFPTIGMRMMDNWLRTDPKFSQMDFHIRQQLVRSLKCWEFEKEKTVIVENETRIILIWGKLETGGSVYSAPARIVVSAQDTLEVLETSWLMPFADGSSPSNLEGSLTILQN